jgi:protein phosphatase
MLSDRGMVRRANEDACGAHPERGVFVVCDGMGGAAAGEVASQLAVQAFLEAISHPRRIGPKSASADGFHSSAQESTADGAAHANHEEAVRAANQAVFRGSQRTRTLRGMGTTLVALLFADAPSVLNGGDLPSGPVVWLAHVGDSRCYLLRRGVLHLLTQDHSLVEEQIQAGLLTRVQAGRSPVRNIITRAVGSQPDVEVEIAAQAIQAGDVFLLASDGLTRDLSEDEIAQILSRAITPELLAACVRNPAALQPTLDAAGRALIDAANAKGGGDNITVLLVPCL